MFFELRDLRSELRSDFLIPSFFFFFFFFDIFGMQREREERIHQPRLSILEVHIDRRSLVFPLILVDLVDFAHVYCFDLWFEVEKRSRSSGARSRRPLMRWLCLMKPLYRLLMVLSCLGSESVGSLFFVIRFMF